MVWKDKKQSMRAAGVMSKGKGECAYCEIERDLRSSILNAREEARFFTGGQLIRQRRCRGEGEEVSENTKEGELKPHCEQDRN